MVTGDKFGKLVYLGDKKSVKNHIYGKFRCDCGTVKFVRTDLVKSGRTRSCGCSNKNEFGINSKDYERLYNAWSNMCRRCYNKASDRYYAYGAKGITVCDEWRNDFHSFARFAVDNGWNPKLSIERIDVHKGYEPNNCTFISMKQQARNKTSNIKVVYRDEEKCIAEWCEILGLNDKRTYRRYDLGIRNPEILFYPGDLRSATKEVFGSD